MSTTQSQQVMWQGRDGDLLAASKRQPDRFPERRPGGMEAGLATTVLAALSLFLVLCYGVSSAVVTRNGYTAIRLRQEVEALRAQGALLRYQINLTQSKQRIAQSAPRLGLQSADPVREVDYVVLPPWEGAMELAAGDPIREQGGLAALLAELANGVVGSGRGEAEASTGEGSR